jgi:hypothetical protein
MTQRSSICKKAIICGLNPTAGSHARVWRPERKQVISVGGQHCCSFRIGHLFGVDCPPETFSAPPHNADIRSELYDILECKQVLQKSGSGASASSIAENFIFQNSAKATYIRKPNRGDGIDDKDFAGGSL